MAHNEPESQTRKEQTRKLLETLGEDFFGILVVARRILIMTLTLFNVLNGKIYDDKKKGMKKKK